MFSNIYVELALLLIHMNILISNVDFAQNKVKDPKCPKQSFKIHFFFEEED